MDTSCVMSMAVPGSAATTMRTSVMPSSYALQISESAITASYEEHNDSARNVSKDVKRKEAFTKKADKRLSSNTLTTLTTANMEKDIEKLNIDIHKLTVEIEKIQMDKKYLLHLKINKGCLQNMHAPLYGL
ncbi:uncharacterized protein LOC127833961 isoform X2 [Dreissena polymorpha]|uniref:uncharacterized protein LOC127833961 isoform X2 n=1 Tax=Dreissena polymorpha TaxID=45954 RepID=UPI002264C500|nr:uncharacterized protein LOC127833961 isoform X2 [Dreissena polymorpha]